MSEIKNDITTPEDVKILVDRFYDKVKVSSVIGFIFQEIAAVDWEKHLPIMYSFWGSILLGEKNYEGNPMIKHVQLSRKTKMNDEQFNEWLRLFAITLNENFAGPNTVEALTRAQNIARIMQHKINMMHTPIGKL